MADVPVSLFFKNNRKYGVGTVTFDLLLSENHNYRSTVTKHPIEDGSDIADHIHNELESGTVNALISNFSIHSIGLTSNRAQDAFEALVELWKSKTRVTMTTVLKVYNDVVITNMPFMRDASQGESLPISISFEKTKVVTLEEISLELAVSVNDLDTELNKQVAAEANIGETTVDEVSEAELEKILGLEL